MREQKFLRADSFFNFDKKNNLSLRVTILIKLITKSTFFLVAQTSRNLLLVITIYDHILDVSLPEFLVPKAYPLLNASRVVMFA